MVTQPGTSLHSFRSIPSFLLGFGLPRLWVASPQGKRKKTSNQEFFLESIAFQASISHRRRGSNAVLKYVICEAYALSLLSLTWISQPSQTFFHFREGKRLLGSWIYPMRPRPRGPQGSLA